MQMAGFDKKVSICLDSIVDSLCKHAYRSEG